MKFILTITLLISFLGFQACSLMTTHKAERAIASEGKLKLPVVYDLAKLEKREDWKKTKKFHIPPAAIKDMEMDIPNKAYQQPYPAVFLQNDYLVVCQDDCYKPQELFPEKEGENYLFAFETAEKKKRKVSKENQALLRTTTVYYWLSRFLKEMQVYGLLPEKRLEVYIDRDYDSMKNNAFYAPGDNSLSFLPAKRNLLMKLLQNYKLNPSAADPAVIMHEMAHYLFHMRLGTGKLMNRSVESGLNEAWADYLALSVLDDDKMGVIFTGGKPGGLRDYRVDAETIKKFYKKFNAQKGPVEEKEEHDIGEAVTFLSLGVKRMLIEKGIAKEEADKIFISAVLETIKNPFATITSFMHNYFVGLAAHDEIQEKVPEILEAYAKAGVGAFPLPEADFDVLSEIEKAVSTSSDAFVTAGVSLEYGLKYQMMGLPKRHYFKLGLMNLIDLSSEVVKKEGESDEDFAIREKFTPAPILYKFQIEGDNISTPFWMLYEQKTKQMLSVYRLDGKILTHEDAGILSQIEAIYPHLSEIAGFLAPSVSEILSETLKLEKNWRDKAKHKSTLTKTEDLEFYYKGKLHDAYRESYKVSPKFLAFLRKKDNTKLTWVKDDLGLEHVYKNDKGHSLVGYQYFEKDTFSYKIMLIDAN